MAEPTEPQRAALRRAFVGLAATMVAMALLLFLPAGTMHWLLGWVFWILFVAACLIAVAVLWRLNPEIFEARSRIQVGTKRLDYFFIAIVIAGFALILPVAGLDFRFDWSQMPRSAVVAGYVLFVLSFAGSMWPPAVSRHFEPGVRIQTDRGHAVIDTGPYAIVRHPGYVCAAVLGVAMALALGSWWALVPAVIAAIVLIPRTIFEERVLSAELPGYREYTRRVTSRWVPGVW